MLQRFFSRSYLEGVKMADGSSGVRQVLSPSDNPSKERKRGRAWEGKRKGGEGVEGGKKTNQ